MKDETLTNGHKLDCPLNVYNFIFLEHDSLR